MGDAKKRSPVTPEEFVLTWQSSATVEEAAKRLGMLVNTANARANSYRKKGVKLKHMPMRYKRTMDDMRLNILAFTRRSA